VSAYLTRDQLAAFAGRRVEITMQMKPVRRWWIQVTLLGVHEVRAGEVAGWVIVDGEQDGWPQTAMLSRVTAIREVGDE